MCSSAVFRSSVIVFLLVFFNGGSIALAALVFFYGPAQTFQIVQFAMAGGSFILAILLPLCVITRKKGTLLEPLVYLLICAINTTASVFITFRWHNHKLENDYSRVPKAAQITILVLAVSWAAAMIALIGFVLATIDSYTKREGDGFRRKKGRRGSLPIQDPPRKLQSNPYAQPARTTYERTQYPTF
ncbi:hypothetical protein DFH11DRAFT_1095487 [Phellopilus nigrolimitatus]|nr:hypothetical protein DFH11DRAFT_1095487 [Phellopilus nigrolimitatus]